MGKGNNNCGYCYCHSSVKFYRALINVTRTAPSTGLILSPHNHLIIEQRALNMTR